MVKSHLKEPKLTKIEEELQNKVSQNRDELTKHNNIVEFLHYRENGLSIIDYFKNELDYELNEINNIIENVYVFDTIEESISDYLSIVYKIDEHSNINDILDYEQIKYEMNFGSEYFELDNGMVINYVY